MSPASYQTAPPRVSDGSIILKEGEPVCNRPVSHFLTKIWAWFRLGVELEGEGGDGRENVLPKLP